MENVTDMEDIKARRVAAVFDTLLYGGRHGHSGRIFVRTRDVDIVEDLKKCAGGNITKQADNVYFWYGSVKNKEFLEKVLTHMCSANKKVKLVDALTIGARTGQPRGRKPIVQNVDIIEQVVRTLAPDKQIPDALKVRSSSAPQGPAVQQCIKILDCFLILGNKKKYSEGQRDKAREELKRHRANVAQGIYTP